MTTRVRSSMYVIYHRWVTEEWSKCSKTCGGGKEKRRIRCRQKVSAIKDKKLKKSKCKHLPRPMHIQRCNTQECPPSWHTSKWTKVVFHVFAVLFCSILDDVKMPRTSITVEIQSTLVISKSKGPSKTLRDIRISTYQICSIEEKTI